ncbi:MAG: L-threonylcarbamoyladenylate synthase, partial [Methylophilus sp.]
MRNRALTSWPRKSVSTVRRCARTSVTAPSKVSRPRIGSSMSATPAAYSSKHHGIRRFRLDARGLRHYLKHGGVIAYPTESVFGLGCDPANRAAVKRIL